MWVAPPAAEVELPVLAAVDLAVLVVLALAQVVAQAHRVQPPLLVLARAHLPGLVPLVPVGPPVLADLVVAPVVPLQHLLSRQLFSAAMARSTPSPRAMCEPVPRSRWPPKGRT